MNLQWLPGFLTISLGLILIGLSFKKSLLKKGTKNAPLEDFFKEEWTANFTRSKNLPENSLIKIDINDYPKVNDIACEALYEEIVLCSTRQMINLKGKSNLELKRTYGISQLEKLAHYERNYMTFVDISCKYGKMLYDNGYITEAQIVLESLLAHNCDVSMCYLLLTQIYQIKNNQAALNTLRTLALKNMSGSFYLNKVIQAIDS